MLEILAVHRGRVVGKSALADRLWRGRVPLAVDAAIETHVSLLRKALGEPGAVETVSRGYRLGPVEVDLEMFDGLVAEDTLASLKRAIALARSEVGDHDAAAPWFRTAREQYGRRLTEVISRTARLALENGELALAVEQSRRALQRDRLRELDYQTLMAATYLVGDRSASLRAFEQCRQTLSRQLGTDPGQVTSALHRSVLLGLQVGLALGDFEETGPRALVLEEDGRRQGALIQACGLAGYTSELVVDVSTALARLGARRYQLVLVSETLAAIAGLEVGEGARLVVVGGEPAIGDLVAAISSAPVAADQPV